MLREAWSSSVLRHSLPLLLQPIQEEHLQLPSAPPLTFAVSTYEPSVGGKGTSVTRVKFFLGRPTFSSLHAPPLLSMSVTTGVRNQVKHCSSYSSLGCTGVLFRGALYFNLLMENKWGRDGNQSKEERYVRTSSCLHSETLFVSVLDFEWVGFGSLKTLSWLSSTAVHNLTFSQSNAFWDSDRRCCFQVFHLHFQPLFFNFELCPQQLVVKNWGFGERRSF